MLDGVSARCSYCPEFAVYRIGWTTYELHACSNHKFEAYNDYHLICKFDAPKMISESDLGFPKTATKTEE